MLPGSSDDKWVATFPRRLPAFHRNWTGFHIYRLPLRREGDGFAQAR